MPSKVGAIHQLLAAILCNALAGRGKEGLLHDLQFIPSQQKIAEIASGAFITKADEDIRGSGYCVESLEAALWCFFHTDSFEGAVLRAANLGDDADTTGAICGQLAGAFYGINSIPRHWLETLAQREYIEEMAIGLHARFGVSEGRELQMG